MVNVIRSVGYALGKLHTGMIVYLCDLWNEGTKEPLQSFLSTLDVPLDGVEYLDAQPEYQGIDLVIWDKGQGCALAMIEMKVDDHEHDVVYKKLADENKKGPQTEIYPRIAELEKWNCGHYLFVTLGAGEYYDKPAGCQPQGKFRWIQIRDFAKALDAVKTNDPVILAWRDAVHQEIALQAAAFRGEKYGWCNGKYRSATWNLYLLGGLKQRLSAPNKQHSDDPNKQSSEDTDWLRKLGSGMRVYTSGSRPDTILHFGWAKNPYYMETNFGGKLNLKVWFPDDDSADQKEEKFKKAREYYIALLKNCCPDVQCEENQRGGFSKTKTILSFTFGLGSTNGCLYYEKAREHTCCKLSKIVKMFAENPCPPESREQ